MVIATNTRNHTKTAALFIKQNRNQFL